MVAPSSSSLRLCRRSPLRFPLASDAFWRCRFPQGSRFPRLHLLPPASPLIQISGCPSLRTSGFTGDRSSSRPDSLSFGGAGCESSRLPLCFAPPVSPTISIRVAPDAHPPVPADFRSESPRSSVPSGRPLRISGLLRRVALGFVVRPFPNSPWFLFAQRSRFRPPRVTPKLPSSADPYLHPQVAPASTSTAGSMITPWLNRTLHPRLAPLMNLRYQSGTSIPYLISSAPLISIHRSQSADHELQTKTVVCAFHQARAAVPISYKVTS